MTSNLGRLVLLFFLFAVPLANAETIRRFDVDLTIQPTGVLHVVETIEYDFGELQRHGIFRDIPVRARSTYGVLQRVGLSNFSVLMDKKEIHWTDLAGNGDAGPTVVIKIGSIYETVTGVHAYTIDYDVARGLLPAENDRDAVRWNVTGTGWPVSILAATLRAHLPPVLARNGVRVSSFTGPYGSTENRASGEWIDDRTYVANASRFAPHEGLTVQFSFPRGALGQTSEISAEEWMHAYIPWLLLLSMALGFYFIWRNFGRDPEVGSIVVRYSPPAGIEAAQAGLLKDQLIEEVCTSAAVLELARDGYMVIAARKPPESMSTHSAFDSEVYTLTRIDRKDEPPLERYKKVLLDGFFDGGPKFTIGEKNSTDRSNKLYSALQSFNAELYKWSVAEKYIAHHPVWMRTCYIGGAALILITFFSFCAWYTDEVPFRQVMDGVPYRLLFLCSFWGTAIMGIILGWNMPKVTFKGIKKVGEILGFREFMKRVDADTIKQQLERDPLYLDKTLPYAVALGVAEHWLKRFHDVGVSPPVWYSGSWNSYSRFTSSSSLGGGLAGLSSVSGGQSGGGGFSGGGGGGGGGGSW